MHAFNERGRPRTAEALQDLGGGRAPPCRVFDAEKLERDRQNPQYSNTPMAATIPGSGRLISTFAYDLR